MAIKLIDTIEPRNSLYPSVRAENVWFADNSKLQDKNFGTIDLTKYITLNEDEGTITQAGINAIEGGFGNKVFSYKILDLFNSYSSSIRDNGSSYIIQFVVLKDDEYTYQFILKINKSTLIVKKQESQFVEKAQDPIYIEGGMIKAVIAEREDIEKLFK